MRHVCLQLLQHGVKMLTFTVSTVKAAENMRRLKCLCDYGTQSQFN